MRAPLLASRGAFWGIAILVLAAGGVAGASAQQSVPVVADSEIALRPAPFGVGEEATYKVTLGPFGQVGRGSMEVAASDTVRGVETYLLRMKLKGGLLFAHVDDEMESWVEPGDFQSVRFYKNLHELNYKKKDTLSFYPSRMRWVGSDGKSGKLGSERPLDDISFIYFARLLPLEVGHTYTFNRYFKPDGNPVVLHVLRRDTVTVPAGRFATIVVQPVIQTKGLFGKGGKAELYFTDDAQRLLVKMKSEVPIIGALGLELTSYTPGRQAGGTAGSSAKQKAHER